MGKRGPAPKGAFENKSQVLSTRIMPDTRANLEAAAKASGRSLSQEIEHRLRRTFIEDEKMSDAFGSRRVYLMMRLAALALEKDCGKWLDDENDFDRALEVLNKLFSAIRPSGSRSTEIIQYNLPAAEWTKVIWSLVQGSKISMPLSDGTRSEHFAAVVRAEMGSVALRANILGEDRQELLRELEQAFPDEDFSQLNDGELANRYAIYRRTRDGNGS